MVDFTQSGSDRLSSLYFLVLFSDCLESCWFYLNANITIQKRVKMHFQPYIVLKRLTGTVLGYRAGKVIFASLHLFRKMKNSQPHLISFFLLLILQKTSYLPVSVRFTPVMDMGFYSWDKFVRNLQHDT